jgi:hypothetical protein
MYYELRSSIADYGFGSRHEGDKASCDGRGKYQENKEAEQSVSELYPSQEEGGKE